MRHCSFRVRSLTLFVFAFLLPFSLYAQSQDLQAVPVSTDPNPASQSGIATLHHPREDRLVRGHSFHGDLRTLPQAPPQKMERPEFEEPVLNPIVHPGTPAAPSTPAVSSSAPVISAPAPAASNSFEGLDFTNWGAGHPPDTNGDVGPQYYIQTINTSVGIYNKSDGSRVTAFIFNTLMSQGNFGNLCDTSNFGDPVVLYDTFEDRWIITDFAFNLSGGNPVAPEFQCFAVSKSGDPVAGGWNFYSIQVSGGFGDYPKFGIWPDGLYMSANVFGFGAGGAFQNVRVWALNKAQMYAGAATVQVVSFDAPSAEFTLLPSNARLQTGTPPAGSPNYFSVVAQFLNVVSVYKFHTDWNNTAAATFTGPFMSLTATNWSQLLAANQTEQSPGNKLDTLYFRLMMQNQYTNIGGVESLWNTHTVGGSGVSSAQSAVRYYEVKVTGGTVEANASQAFTYSPDATVFRFMPSVAVDRAGDMAIGYSATNATLNPAIRYAGRLAGDPVNSITQTEQSLIEGTGTQSGNCGASSCTRWGDYSAMTLDPDGCTFWYTNMYYQTTGLAFNTRVGAFSFPGCTPTVAGALQGTVTASGSGNPISGATIVLGSRTTTTDVNGSYSFAGLPSGTYPSVTASFAGFNSITIASVVINDGLTTTQDFSLTTAPTSGCLTDTTQADFQLGVPTNCDLTSSPGDVTLANAPTLDQSNTAGTTTGTSFATTSWGGQTFIPAVTGTLVKADVQLFCSGCTGTTPNLTLSVRATSGGLPTGADLAFATIPGFSSGAGIYYTVSFGSPATLTAGTQYALILRPESAPSAGGYFWIRSSPSTYANGQRVISTTNGATWTADSTRDFNFRAYMQTGFALSGTFVSSLKDANPATGATANWSTLSWNADTPAGTSVQFQIAASNNAAGPFNFVGPDNTASTFFSNGDSLAQFAGNRYLKYQASFSTNDTATTPTLHDVTVCFNDTPATTLVVAAASGIFGGTADLSATLSSSGVGLSSKSVTFTLNGNNAGSAITDGSGIATVSAASLAGINAGSYPGGVGASFAGDSGFNASSGSGDLTVSKIDQTITFGALAGKIFGDADFSVSASATSGLTVSFGASGNCTVTGVTVHITGAGSCTITASQIGDGNYNPATDVPQTFSISKAAQTITFGALGGKIFGDADFSVSASSSSTLAVSFGASGNCSVTGSTVHLTGAGSCTITASQAGDGNYNPAADVPQSFSIAKAGQTITFGALGGKTFGDADFSVSASSISALAVSFGASGNCTVTGSTVHLTGAGSCTITATQAGDANFNPATDVPQAFTIAKGNQTITFGALANKNFGDPDFSVSASASSALAVAFAATGNCSMTGSTVHLTSVGSCTITASQVGDSNFNPATDVPQAFTIAKGNQTITFGALANKTFGNPDFSVGASSSASLTVSFAATGNCSVTGSTVHLTGAGSCTITASQAGDSNFNPAADVPQAFSIAKASQTITFGALANKIFGNPDFGVSGTASSGLAVSFGASGVCTVSGSTVHLTGSGACTITAAQAGDANFNPATSVPQSFVVAVPDFSIAPTLPSVTIKAGQQATEHISLVPNAPTGSAITFACSGLPTLSTCSFTPSTVPAGSPQVDVVLTINTTGPSAALARSQIFYAAWLPFTGAGLFGIVMIATRKRSRKAAASLAVLALMLAILLIGCGGHSTTPPTNPGTPVGTSTVTVTATSATVTHSTTFVLTVN